MLVVYKLSVWPTSTPLLTTKRVAYKHALMQRGQE